MLWARYRYSISAALVCAALIVPGCATKEVPISQTVSVNRNQPLAVLPIHNISASQAPLREIHRILVKTLENAGVDLIDQGQVDAFIRRHRLRYLGGIDQPTAQALRRETGAVAVLITSLELYNFGVPPAMLSGDGLTPVMGAAFTSIPKISLSARLVSTENVPSIAWINGIGLSGDQAPGLLNISLITDPLVLAEKAVSSISHSLTSFLTEEGYPYNGEPRDVFAPNSAYTSPILDPETTYRVAVAPFYNVSERRYAGEIMPLHFLNHLKPKEHFVVVEPGLIRDTFLECRIIMDDGLSLANADIVFSKLDADLVLAGQVIEYQDYQGETGKPKVDFSAVLIERQSREVIWACESHKQGDEKVYFFERGKAYTAHALASQMVKLAVKTIGEE